ncbi:hypothetical protein VTL71DRAFT_14258, partial [Oculimacula yallundae]
MLAAHPRVERVAVGKQNNSRHVITTLRLSTKFSSRGVKTEGDSCSPATEAATVDWLRKLMEIGLLSDLTTRIWPQMTIRRLVKGCYNPIHVGSIYRPCKRQVFAFLASSI